MTPPEPLQLGRVRSRAAVPAAVVAVLLVVLGLTLLGSAALALATTSIDLRAAATVVFLGGLGAWQVLVGVRRARELRALLAPLVVLRLDEAGVHVRQGAERGPRGAWWLTVPWDDVGWVASSGLDDEVVAAVEPGAATRDRAGCGLLRFVLRDDRRLPSPPGSVPDGRDDPVLLVRAFHLGLTPDQARLACLASAPDRARVLAWLRHARPASAVVESAALPWVAPGTPEPWPGQPRVAVLGAADRLGRLVLERLATPGSPAPVALARNEAHRSVLERLGAEVRMIDAGVAGSDWWATALRSCASLVVTTRTLASPDLLVACRDTARRVVLVEDGRPGPHPDPAWLHDLDWTVLRVTALLVEPAHGEVEVGEDVVPGAVPLGDLADVVVAALRDPAAVDGAWNVAPGSSPDSSTDPSPGAFPPSA